jgi:hypothetical protein
MQMLYRLLLRLCLPLTVIYTIYIYRIMRQSYRELKYNRSRDSSINLSYLLSLWIYKELWDIIHTPTGPVICRKPFTIFGADGYKPSEKTNIFKYLSSSLDPARSVRIPLKQAKRIHFCTTQWQAHYDDYLSLKYLVLTC